MTTQTACATLPINWADELGACHWPAPIITKNITIDGNGNNPAISGASTYRPFFIGDAGTTGATYAMTLKNLTIANAMAGRQRDRWRRRRRQRKLDQQSFRWRWAIRTIPRHCIDVTRAMEVVVQLHQVLPERGG